jgi:hypothetical protein
MLIDEYGVTPKNSEWYAASLHHWDKGPTEDAVTLPGGVTIRVLQGAGNATARALRALEDGSLDLLAVTESQLATLSWQFARVWLTKGRSCPGSCSNCSPNQKSVAKSGRGAFQAR